MLNKFLHFFFPKNIQFFKKPAFQLAMVALIVILLIPFLWQERTAQYAMNEGQRKLEVEKVQKDRIEERDRKSTRLNSSHVRISYAVFCLKKKKKQKKKQTHTIKTTKS